MLPGAVLRFQDYDPSTVQLTAVRRTASDNPLAKQWVVPSAEEATHGWWGLAESGRVRAAPSVDAPVVGEFASGEHVKVLSDEHGDAVDGVDTWYRIDGGRFAGGHIHSSLIQRLPDPQPTLAPSSRELSHDPWIVVDRAASTLSLLRDGQAQFTTYVSLGQAGVDTPDGEYSTFIKYRADRMTSTTVPQGGAQSALARGGHRLRGGR